MCNDNDSKAWNQTPSLKPNSHKARSVTGTEAGADGAPDSLMTLGLSSLWASVSPPVKSRLFED